MRHLALVLLWLAASGSTAAAVTAHQAWIRLLPGTLPAAGYLQLTNSGADGVQLVGTHSTSFGNIELHSSLSPSGVARMRRVDKLTIPAGATVALKPRGYHLMLFRPAAGLQPGGQVPVTLEFSDGSRLSVPFTLRNASGQ